MEFGKRIRRMALALAAAAFLCVTDMEAQELKCAVEVNSSSVEGTYKSVFESLQSAMSDYLNETRWSKATFSPNERIECRFFLTVKEYKDDRVKGEIQAQLSRPVYNSTYTTTLFNFRDTRVEFEYREGDPLVFNETSIDNNLVALLNYYAYLFLAIDFDSFSPNGGQEFYDKAASIVQMSQSSGEIGWRTFEDTKNRSAVLNSFTEANTSAVRDMIYKYHRRGLDEMVTSPDKGRAVITESLQALKTVHENAPMSVALSLFKDAKLDELVNIYSKAPESERKQVYDLLQTIYPTENTRLEKIRKPDETNK